MMEKTIVKVAMDGRGVLSRRGFLRGVGLGAAGLSAVSFTDLMALRADELRQRQMSCILLWMAGGPSQFETFDPKPGHKNGGETKAIETAVPGLSIAEGWEPVAMRRLIEGGSPNLPRPITRGDIRSYGEKLDISPITGGSPGTIEADCLLTDGTFFDMKHSLTGDPRVAQNQVDLLETVLGDPLGRSPIRRAVFVPNAPVGQAVLDRINAANSALRARLGITEDLIRIVEDLGNFP